MTTFDMPPAGSWEERGGWVVRALMRDLALTDEQAAGLVGNLGYESAQFTAYHEGGVPADKGGVGWAQWTASRRRNYESWCRLTERDPRSDEANYGFLLDELRTDFAYFAASLQKCVTVEAACRLTHKVYETPSDVLDGSYRSQPARLALARRVMPAADAPPVLQIEPASPRELQARLVQLGYPVTIDGDAGPQTCGAALDALRGA